MNGNILEPVPINEAEAIIEPFWLWGDGYPRRQRWVFEAGEGTGAELVANWATLNFSWMRPTPCGPVFRLEFKGRVDCEGYDNLVLRAQMPKGTVMRVCGNSERGSFEHAITDDSEGPREHTVPLNGAVSLETIAIEMDAGSCGQGNGQFYWLGLSNIDMLEGYRRRWQRLRRRNWSEPHLEPAESEPGFVPTAGVFLTVEELSRLREQAAAMGGENPLLNVRDTMLADEYRPEDDMADYIGAYWEFMIRDRDQGRIARLIGPGGRAAVAGIVLKDKGLLRLAARYALSLAACNHWIDGFPCTFHGWEFNSKAFGVSYAMREIALIFDLAGDCITYVGKEYLRRRLAEEGLGFTNYVCWRWEYVHACNQLAFFSNGRLPAALVIESSSPRMRPYTELALDELNKSMENILLPDGSFVEGPGYLTSTLANAIPAYLQYARVRGMTPAAVLPVAMQRSADYVEAFMATDEATDYLATNECGSDVSRADPSSVALLAAALPHSHWTTVYHKVRKRTPAVTIDPLYWSLVAGIPDTEPPRRPFIHLREGGFISSLRDLNGEPVRIFIMGNRAGAGHCHEDKGSFILEFAGETFAMDSNCYRYDSVYMSLLKRCDRHNMLVPCGAGEERSRPQNPIPVNVFPEGEGDANAFKARIDATPGWEEYYRHWERHWDSPTPAVLEIHDSYELARGEGVEFLWNTRLPISLEDGSAMVNGRHGRARIVWSEGCEASVEALPSPPGRAHNRLTIRKAGIAGELRVRATLETYR